MNQYLVCHTYEDWKKYPNLISVPIKRIDGTRIPLCDSLKVGDKIVYFTIGDPDVVIYNEAEEIAEQEKYGIRGIYEIKEADASDFPYDWDEDNHRLFKLEPVLMASKRIFFENVLNQGTVRQLTQEQFDKIENDIRATL